MKLEREQNEKWNNFLQNTDVFIIIEIALKIIEVEYENFVELYFICV